MRLVVDLLLLIGLAGFIAFMLALMVFGIRMLWKAGKALDGQD